MKNHREPYYAGLTLMDNDVLRMRVMAWATGAAVAEREIAVSPRPETREWTAALEARAELAGWARSWIRRHTPRAPIVAGER